MERGRTYDTGAAYEKKKSNKAHLGDLGSGSIDDLRGKLKVCCRENVQNVKL